MAAPKNYLNNDSLYRQIIISKAKGYLTKDALEMLILLNQRLHTKRAQQNYDDQKDSLQTAILDVLTGWANFDEDRTTNAFAYFTEILKRGSAKSFNKLYKRRGAEGYVKHISLSATGPDGGTLFHI